MKPKIHPTAEVSDKAIIDDDTLIWNNAQIRENTKIGQGCIIGKNVYIDQGVKIGINVKIQNNVSIYNGTEIGNGVFIAPHVCFTNDRYPRAINPDGRLKTTDDWKIGKIIIEEGASIGANSTILPGVTIGKYAMIGAGTVVTKDVPRFTLVYGNPARIKGHVDMKGNIL